MDHRLETRAALPVTLDLALALSAQGDVMAAARRLAELQDPALRPVAVLLLDILAPLMAMGAIDPTGAIDRRAVLGFFIGVLRMDVETLRVTPLDILAAAFEGWRDSQGASRATTPDADFLAQMMRLHPDAGDKTA